jgi:hypothetical protein
VILELISEARASGVRLKPVCGVLGISARTIERWRANPEAGDRRCGPKICIELRNTSGKRCDFWLHLLLQRQLERIGKQAEAPNGTDKFIRPVFNRNVAVPVTRLPQAETLALNIGATTGPE